MIRIRSPEHRNIFDARRQVAILERRPVIRPGSSVTIYIYIYGVSPAESQITHELANGVVVETVLKDRPRLAKRRFSSGIAETERTETSTVERMAVTFILMFG
jgi:hypothetical protein